MRYKNSYILWFSKLWLASSTFISAHQLCIERFENVINEEGNSKGKTQPIQHTSLLSHDLKPNVMIEENDRPYVIIDLHAYTSIA